MQARLPQPTYTVNVFVLHPTYTVNIISVLHPNYTVLYTYTVYTQEDIHYAVNVQSLFLLSSLKTKARFPSVDFCTKGITKGYIKGHPYVATTTSQSLHVFHNSDYYQGVNT